MPILRKSMLRFLVTEACLVMGLWAVTLTPAIAFPLQGQVSLQGPEGPIPAESGAVFVVEGTPENRAFFRGIADGIKRSRINRSQTVIGMRPNDRNAVQKFNGANGRLTGLLTRMVSLARSRAVFNTAVTQGAFSVVSPPQEVHEPIVIVFAQVGAALGWWMSDTPEVSYALDEESVLYRQGTVIPAIPEEQSDIAIK
ncbi:MAG: hypothetical protein WCA07_13740 [Gloeobacterales cyanobacterium]